MQSWVFSLNQKGISNKKAYDIVRLFYGNKSISE